MTNAAAKIFCDESGFTGTDLLNPDQPLFVFASCSMSYEEAENIIEKIRAKFSIQAAELKGSNLWKRNNGKEIAQYFFESVRKKYKLSVHHKKFILATKIFEYVFEPVLQENNALFYEHDFHLFISNVIYLWGFLGEISATTLLSNFRSYVLSPEETELLAELETDKVFSLITTFIRGYREKIKSSMVEINQEQDLSKWLLETSDSSLFVHLAHWGEEHEVIDVTCDESKPLESVKSAFDVMVNRKDKRYISIGGVNHPVTWNMINPIKFASSAETPGLQIADLCASLANQIFKENMSGESENRNLIHEMEEHVINHVLPDNSYIDLKQPLPKTNYLVLFELAERASQEANPIRGMDLFYQQGLRTAHKHLK